jgi:NAD(P)-dependent dehydrogenase (short-subunit alcohol dehydrogenase family)
MTVLLAARDQRRCDEAAAVLRAADLDVHLIILDVTDPATIRAAAEQVAERTGRLDVLVNNTGISGGALHPPSAADLEIVREVFDTNVFGVLRVINAMLPLLKRSPAGRIVNVSSGVGSMGDMTDPDHYMGLTITRTAAEGAAIVVRLATLGPDGPTGGFFDDNGPVRW